jgi:hypothetical protein
MLRCLLRPACPAARHVTCNICSSVGCQTDLEFALRTATGHCTVSTCEQAAIRRRDEEIARLAARLEAAKPGNTEALELRARQQAETIVQLHGQLEEATSHMQTLTATAERVKAAESASQQAVAARKVCLEQRSSPQTLTSSHRLCTS